MHNPSLNPDAKKLRFLVPSAALQRRLAPRMPFGSAHAK